MVDSSLILQHIQSEQISDTWHVMRPQRQVRIATIGGMIVFGLGFNLLFDEIGSSILSNMTKQQLGNTLVDAYIHYPLPAILTQLAAIWLTLLLRRYAITVQDAIFVLLPEGIFHCKRLSDENRRKIAYIEYQKIQRMVLEVSKGGDLVQRKVATFDLSPLDPSSLQENKTVPPIFGRFEFHFYDKDGTKTTWFPPQIYRPGFLGVAEIAQWVLDGYRAFALEQLSKREKHF